MSNAPNHRRNPKTGQRANAATQRAQASRTPVLFAVGIVILVVALGIGLAFARSSDDPAAGLVFGPVDVEGAALPLFDSEAATDPAVGTAAPVLSGLTLAEAPVEVGGAGEPTLVVFVAHWCPHCQVELPLLVDMAGEGAFDGIRTVAVLTGTNEDAVNFPPAAWLDKENWTGDVLVDSQDNVAATAYGLAGYPYLVMLDADGNVTARASGELPAEDIAALVATGTSAG